MRIFEIWWRPPSVRAALLAGAIVAVAGGTAAAAQFGDWHNVQNAAEMAGSSPLVNTDANDGCPILDPYDNSLYMASSRGGDLDIWVAPWTGNGWGQPVNAGPKINTSAAEFCPDPARGNRLFFVRRLSATNTDIYVSKRLPNGGFQTAEPLNRGDNAINSSAEEWSPSWFEAGGHEYLYFSSTREGRQRIYYSVDGGPAQLAKGAVNTSDATVQYLVQTYGTMGWRSFGTPPGMGRWADRTSGRRRDRRWMRHGATQGISMRRSTASRRTVERPSHGMERA